MNIWAFASCNSESEKEKVDICDGFTCDDMMKQLRLS